jgi:tetratricopeptide (TPR) repeat protein
LVVQYTLARAIGDLGPDRLEEAVELARETLDQQQRAKNPNDWNTGNMALTLGRLLVDQEHFDEAHPFLEQARGLFQQSYFMHKAEKITVAENLLGAIQLARSNYAEATRLIEPSAEQFITPRTIVAISPGERRAAVGRVVKLYQALSKPDQAAVWRKKLDQLSPQKSSDTQR